MPHLHKLFVVSIFTLSTLFAYSNDVSFEDYVAATSDSLKIKIINSYIDQSFSLGKDSTFGIINRAIRLATRNHQDNLLIELRICQAALYRRYSEFERSLALYQKLLDEAKVIEDTPRMAKLHTDIATIHFDLEQYGKYIEHLNRGLGLVGDKNSIVKGYIYSNFLGFYARDPAQHDKAIGYAEKAIQEFEKSNLPEQLSSVYNNLATVYYYKDSPKGYQKAMLNYKKAEDAYYKSDNLIGQATAALNIGYCYMQLNQLDSALHQGYQALNMFKKTEDISSISDVWWFLAEVNYLKGDYKSAYHAQDSFYTIYDSINSTETRNAILKLETQYQTKEREQENALLKSKNELQQAEIEKQTIFGYAVSGGLVFLMITSALIYIQFRNKKKANLLLEHKNHEIEEKNAKITVQKEEITESINYARRIQRALLNVDTEVSKNFPPFFIYFQPRDIVSGDFYWATEKNGYVYATAADCTGHGVPGAFMSMLGISFLNEIIKMHDVITPAELLNSLRTRIISELGQGETGDSKDGMDMCLIRYHPVSREVRFAGANNPLYVVTDDPEKYKLADRMVEVENMSQKLVELKVDKQPVGYQSKARKFSEQRLTIKKGEYIYMFSDGFADQFGGQKGKKIGYKTFKKLLLELSAKPLEKQKKELKTYYNHWIDQSDEEQIDDVCVIGIQF